MCFGGISSKDEAVVIKSRVRPRAGGERTYVQEPVNYQRDQYYYVEERRSAPRYRQSHEAEPRRSSRTVVEERRVSRQTRRD